MKMEVIVVLIAILAILVVELFALSKGINGQCLRFSVAAMAGLGGYLTKEIILKVRGR